MSFSFASVFSAFLSLPNVARWRSNFQISAKRRIYKIQVKYLMIPGLNIQVQILTFMMNSWSMFFTENALFHISNASKWKFSYIDSLWIWTLITIPCRAQISLTLEMQMFSEFKCKLLWNWVKALNWGYIFWANFLQFESHSFCKCNAVVSINFLWILILNIS